MVEKLARWDMEHNDGAVRKRAGNWPSEWTLGSACTGTGSFPGCNVM